MQELPAGSLDTQILVRHRNTDRCNTCFLTTQYFFNIWPRIKTSGIFIQANFNRAHLLILWILRLYLPCVTTQLVYGNIYCFISWLVCIYVLFNILCLLVCSFIIITYGLLVSIVCVLVSCSLCHNVFQVEIHMSNTLEEHIIYTLTVYNYSYTSNFSLLVFTIFTMVMFFYKQDELHCCTKFY